jgi:hypothetical protein
MRIGKTIKTGVIKQIMRVRETIYATPCGGWVCPIQSLSEEEVFIALEIRRLSPDVITSVRECINYYSNNKK